MIAIAVSWFGMYDPPRLIINWISQAIFTFSH
jgi:hypothetical protein